VISQWIPPRVTTAQRGALIVGLLGVALSIVGWLLNPAGFFRAYLFAFLFWTMLSVGCLGILMFSHLTGGSWAAATRRILESGTRTLPLMGLLFIPLLFGLPAVYSWARPEIVAADPTLQHKVAYLNVPFLIIRTAAYFCIWIVLAYYLNVWSTAQDADPDPRWANRMRRLSAGGMVAFGLTGTFAAVDWSMSIEPSWSSSIYPSMVLIGAIVSAFALAVGLLACLQRTEPLSELTSSQQLSDVGSMLMSFLLLWAYLAYSQFMLVWAGNLQEEIPWYLHRITEGWGPIAVAVVLGAFAVPFLALFSTQVRHSTRLMALLGLGTTAAHLLATLWLIVPGFDAGNASFWWLYVAAPAGIGGLWLALLFHQLSRRPLVPRHDPRFVLQPDPDHA
jgi:hypothetical protein